MKPIPLALFTVAAASPLILLGLGCAFGGVFIWMALAYMALASVALDSLIPWVAGESDAREFPAADLLLISLGLGALMALPLLVGAIAASGGVLEGVALFLAGGLWFGQVAHPAAHELIHRRGRFAFWLGVAVYSGLLFGHHASAHRLVHHRFVATGDDPNSARTGESYYRFVIRAWPGSIRAGLAAERALRGGSDPYVVYGGLAMLALGMGYAVAGVAGVLIWLGLGMHFGLQVLLSDYVQHYGLTRGLIAGRTLPVAACHSWNSPHWFSSALMLNAPRHSDHHSHPNRPYPALRLPEDAPRLPWPLPIACVVALFPRVWRRRMKPMLALIAKP